MQQGTKHTDRGKTKPKKHSASRRRGIYSSRPHRQKFGTSKLEEKFAHQFLDKLGVKYVYQYEATNIGRYFDFRIYHEYEGGAKHMGPIIEIQGTYWHADPRVYDVEDLNRTQKRDIIIDEVKRKWCSKNGIRVIYVWEKDINERPSEVMSMLKEELKAYRSEIELLDDKRKRH
jgi:hypothetical protein